VPQSSSLVYFRSSRVDVRLLPHPTERNLSSAVVKLLGKRWWIPIDARLEGPELEPEEPRAEVGFPTADQGFSSIQGTLFGFFGI